MQRTNWDEALKDVVKPDSCERQNPFPFPKHYFRWLLVGASGCGKTSFLLDALLGGLVYDKLWLFCKNPYEQKYQFLIKHFSDLEKEFEEETGQTIELIRVGTTGEEFPKVDDLDKNIQNLFVIDDFVVDQKALNTIIKDHFIRGRKASASYIILQQSYYETPKTIRINCNHFSFWKLNSASDLRGIMSDHALDVDYPDLLKMYREATKEKYNMFHLDMQTEDPGLRFRKNLDSIYKTERSVL